MPDATVGIMGTVQAQANSSTKLKLNMVWLKSDSAPTHLAAATMIEIRLKMAKGAKMYIMIIGGITL